MQNPRKKIIQRGRYTVLPIVGDTISELRLQASHSPTIIFRDSTGDESQLVFGEAVLMRGGVEERVNPFPDGGGFRPQQLGPTLELLGASVTDAWAQPDGSLEITVSSGWTFRVVLPGGGYDGWNFQYPRAGLPVGGDLKNYLSLFGYEGGLVGSGTSL